MIVTCSVCGNDIKRSPAEAKKYKSHTCSKECQATLMSQKLKGSKLPKRAKFSIYDSVSIDGESILEHRHTMSLLGYQIKGKVIHHIDENPHNNDPANLEIMTHREHTKLHCMIYSDDLVYEALTLVSDGITVTEASKRLKINRMVLSNIVHYRRRQDVYDKWMEEHDGRKPY